jgi:hypothetical protein
VTNPIDMELRGQALNAALGLNPGGVAETVLRDAERFYAFLKGQGAPAETDRRMEYVK